MNAPRFTTAPGVEALLLEAGALLDIRIEPAPRSDALTKAIDERWDALRLANPRFHDGEVLSVLSWHTTSITCKRASFRELAVRPEVPTGCELLAMTAVVSARGSDGHPRILLGRRHRETRVYGGLWELGPSGGIPPPEGKVVTTADLLRQVEAELHEEAGLSLAGADITLAGIVRDLQAFSLDAAFRVVLPVPLADLRPGERDWEYEEIRWLTPDEALSQANSHPAEFIPPTRLMLQDRRWLVPTGR